MNDTTPQPNEAPVDVCQEAKDAAEQLYRWMADECKDHEGKEFLPACVCCDYAGMRHFINAMAKRLNPACLAYAQRKTVEALRWPTASNEAWQRDFESLSKKKFDVEAQLTAAKADIAKLRVALTLIKNDAWPVSDPLNVEGGTLVCLKRRIEQLRLIAWGALAATAANHERKP